MRIVGVFDHFAQVKELKPLLNKDQSIKSCDLDEDEIDEFTLQQQQLEAKQIEMLAEKKKSVTEAFPVRRLDFTNLTPGTPPQQSQRDPRQNCF